MPRLTILAEPVNATPRNFPINQLEKLFPELKKYLERDVKRMLVNDMEKTTKNWKEAPTMVGTVTQPYGTRIQLVVEPKGKGTLKWQRISSGTGPRLIRARTHKGMWFNRDYAPKTTPGGRYGGPGRKSGRWVMAMEVHHTIAPRNFSLKIMKKREDKIRKGVQKIVRKVGKL